MCPHSAALAGSHPASATAFASVAFVKLSAAVFAVAFAFVSPVVAVVKASAAVFAVAFAFVSSVVAFVKAASAALTAASLSFCSTSFAALIAFAISDALKSVPPSTLIAFNKVFTFF